MTNNKTEGQQDQGFLKPWRLLLPCKTEESDSRRRNLEDVFSKMKNHEHLVVRYSPLDGGLVNCGPVLNWLPLDNRGNRLIRREYTLSNLNSLFHVIHFLLLELLEKQLKECMTLLSTTSTISGLCRGF